LAILNLNVSEWSKIFNFKGFADCLTFMLLPFGNQILIGVERPEVGTLWAMAKSLQIQFLADSESINKLVLTFLPLNVK